MKAALLQFLSQFKELSEVQMQHLSEIMQVANFGKNEILVALGQYCNLCYFVLKGCLRQYVVIDGIEKTIAIYTENQAINYYTNQGTFNKADSYLSTFLMSIQVQVGIAKGIN